MLTPHTSIRHPIPTRDKHMLSTWQFLFLAFFRCAAGDAYLGKVYIVSCVFNVLYIRCPPQKPSII
jgi:hypothetical protein